MGYSKVEVKDLVHRTCDEGHVCTWPNHADHSLKPVRIVEKYTNDKISRIKPSEPLWMYPTALPKQWTNTTEPDLYRLQQEFRHLLRPWLQPSYWCSFTRSYEYIGSHRNPGFNDYPDATNWQLEARLKVKEELVNLGETLFEYRESARMFRNLAETLWDAYQTVRGKKVFSKGGLNRLPPKLRRYRTMPYRLRKRLTPASIPAAYIAAEFGVKPLMNDCFLAYDALYNRVQLPIYRRIYAKGTSGSKGEDDGWYRSDRATLYMELEPERDLITMGNPFELAWNLIPFSLVVDWVIPIGETLSALDALRNVKWVKGVLSTKTEFRLLRPLNQAAAPSYTLVRPYRQEYKSHERTVLNSIPFAQQPLRWKPSRSWSHVTKGLALLYLLRGYGRRDSSGFNTFKSDYGSVHF